MQRLDLGLDPLGVPQKQIPLLGSREIGPISPTSS
jgi:hypothetical protein